MLTRDTVLIRWIALAGAGEADVQRLAPLLDDAERARAARFAFERDRVSYVAAHALVRATLSAEAGGPPERWRFDVGPHGRPEIAADQNTAGLRFNLSHTGGFIAVAVTVGGDIGIDVEARARRGMTTEIAHRYFSAAEVAHLARQPEALRRDVFLAFWTLKEAYIKAVGRGLTMPLDAFAFTLDPLSVAFSDRIDDRADGWLFRRLMPTDDTVMALALRHDDPARVRVAVERLTLGDLRAAG